MCGSVPLNGYHSVPLAALQTLNKPTGLVAPTQNRRSRRFPALQKVEWTVLIQKKHLAAGWSVDHIELRMAVGEHLGRSFPIFQVG